MRPHETSRTSLRRGRRDSGTVLIVTMWVVLVLAGLVLVFAHSARVEAVAAANRRAALEADEVARGALAVVLSTVEGAEGSADLLTDTSWEARQVGSGRFWLIRPSSDDSSEATYGPVDEASRVNLNTANVDMLLKLPGMTAELAASIIDWRDGDADVSPGGAESEYYLLRPVPYYCKDGPFETVEELLLVREATPALLYGEDTNRNGVLDTNEDDAEESLPPDNRNGALDRGFLDFITIYGSEPNTDANGEQRISVNSASADLTSVLSGVVPEDRLPIVLLAARRGRPFQNIMDFYVRGGLTIDEFMQVADRLTTATGSTLRGLINVNTAPREVLLCLPQLEEADVDALISYRSGTAADLTNIGWVAAALPQEKAVAIGGAITARSYQFSADIVAVSGDGRAFKRYRAVVDASVSPARVMLWQDLTHLGWPLDPSILTALRKGEYDPNVVVTTG